jgi:hypothetical protein
MPLRTLTTLLLVATFLGVGCDLADPSADGADVRTSPLPPVRPNPSLISGNVWATWDEARTAEFFDRADAVGIGGVRIAGTYELLVGGEAILAGLRRNLDLARGRGMRALIGPHSYDVEGLLATDPQAFHDGGYALRLLLAEYRGTAAGIKVHNEPDLQLRDVLDAGGDGDRVVEAYVTSTEAFVQGVRAAEAEHGLPRLPVWGPSMGEPFEPVLADPFYEAFLPMVDRGDLDGLDFHLYTSGLEYEVVGGDVVRQGASEAELVARLFERLGHVPVPVIITEAGCQSDTLPTEALAAACWAAHLRDLSSISGVRLIGPFSVAPDTSPRYLIEPGTPVGDSVAAFAGRFGWRLSVQG